MQEQGPFFTVISDKIQKKQTAGYMYMLKDSKISENDIMVDIFLQQTLEDLVVACKFVALYNYTTHLKYHIFINFRLLIFRFFFFHMVLISLKNRYSEN